MGAPESRLPGGNEFSSVSFLGPLALPAILRAFPTLSERTVAHSHHMAREYLEGITRVPDLEGCGIQVVRRVLSGREIGGGLRFSYGEPCIQAEGLPTVDDLQESVQVHVYRVLEGGQVYEMEDFSSDEADEVAKTTDLIARRFPGLAPDLTAPAGQMPDQIVIDTIDFDRQRG